MKSSVMMENAMFLGQLKTTCKRLKSSTGPIAAWLLPYLSVLSFSGKILDNRDCKHDEALVTTKVEENTVSLQHIDYQNGGRE